MTRPAALRLAVVALRAQIQRLAYDANLYRVYQVPYARKSAELYRAYRQALEILQAEMTRERAEGQPRNRHAKKV
jgi:hypothetical protein